jgi:hypothetical protein
MKPVMITVNAQNAKQALNEIIKPKLNEFINPAVYTEVYSDSVLVAIRSTSYATAVNHTARVLKDETSRDKYARDNRSTDKVNRKGLSGKTSSNTQVMIVFELMEFAEADTRKAQKLQLVRPQLRVVEQKAIQAVLNGETDMRTVKEAVRTIKNEQRYMMLATH